MVADDQGRQRQGGLKGRRRSSKATKEGPHPEGAAKRRLDSAARPGSLNWGEQAKTIAATGCSAAALRFYACALSVFAGKIILGARRRMSALMHIADSNWGIAGGPMPNSGSRSFRSAVEQQSVARPSARCLPPVP
jgi:hypothetical protein